MLLFSSPFSLNHIHPVLVHFTTALLPTSFASDVIGRFTDRYSFTPAAWWMLFYGAVATPLTALAGWLWAVQIEQAAGSGPDAALETHEWLGFGLVAGFILLAVLRGRAFFSSRKPSWLYLAIAAVVIAALMYQGYLGGKMTLG